MTNKSVGKDELGDRMKMYESAETQRKFMPGIPIVARIDGRSFSKFTRGLDRPYDIAMSNAMIETTKHLVEETNACVGYTQSDEITLMWHTDDTKSQHWFNGRVFKMVSQLAAQATIAFYREVIKNFPPKYADKMPTFDARVWQVPSVEEAANVFLWREWDATKNSISMAAHHHFSHSELHKKSGREQQDMLFTQKGVNWNDYPEFFKRGTYVKRKVFTRKFTPEELENLPEHHEARKNPDIEITRSHVVELDLPPLGRLANKVGVLIGDAQPLLISDLEKMLNKAMDHLK